jgi:hypothetical protein
VKITLMAIVQISKITQRSGNLVDLPQLDEAEFGWATDAKLLFIGKTTPNENIEVLTSYSTIDFSQLNGSVGNLNVNPTTISNGQLLAYDGNNWTNRGGNAAGLITLGEVSNVKITGGAIGYVLETDGLGNLSWTPKATIIAFIEDVTNADPAVVTTTEDNFFTDAQKITITNVQGMTELNGESYFVDVLTSNTFALYSDVSLTTPIDSTGFGTYISGGRAISTVSGGTGGTASPGGANGSVQYNNSNLLDGDANFIWNKDTNLLTVNGNINSGNSTISGVSTASRFISTIPTGTSPFVVTSTTQVANLNAALAGAATTAGTVTTAAQPNITSVGTLTSLGVNGNIIASNITANTGTFSGNGSGISGLNASNLATGTVPSARLTGTYNITASNATTAGTVTANAQPNITSVGILTSLGVSGNITAANITANTGVFSGNANGLTNIPGANVTGTVSSATTSGTVTTNAQPNITSVGTLTALSVSGNVAFSGPVSNLGNVANVRIFGGSTGQILTTNGAGGLSWTDAGTSQFAQFVTQPNQSNITSVGTLTGLNVNGNIVAVNITANIGTFSGNANGLTNIPAGNIAGQVANALVAGTVTTAAQPNITSVGTLTSLAVSGNISASAVSATNFVGSGASITSLNAANLSTGTVPSARLSGSYSISVTSSTTSGTVTTNAQPNITSVGTLTTATVSGNIIAGNVYANTGTLGALRLVGEGGNISNVQGSNVSGAVVNAQTVTLGAQPNITSVGTLTSLNVSGNANVGNIGATNFVGSGASLTNLNASNLTSGTVPSARLSGSYSISVTSATTAGSVTANNQPNITSVGTLTALNVSGNLSADNISGAGAGITSLDATNLTTGAVPSARLAGSYSISVTSAGTVTTNAQPNITSVGTLTSLSVSGSLSAGTISGSGSGIASLNASNISTGTVPTARLGSGTANASTFLAGDNTWKTTGSVTSVAVSGANITVSGSPITSSGTISISIPQAISTTSNVRFGSLGIGTAPSGTSGEIRATGDITAFFSDDRLKDRIENIANPLEKVLKLNGFYYKPNKTAQELGYNDQKLVGVSAQEVQSILPEVVVPAPIDDQYLTVHYEKLIPLLIEAIKELKNEVDALRKK